MGARNQRKNLYTLDYISPGNQLSLNLHDQKPGFLESVSPLQIP